MASFGRADQGDRQSIDELPDGLEPSCLAEAGGFSLILAHFGEPGGAPYGPSRQPQILAIVQGFSEMLGRRELGSSSLGLGEK